MKFLYPEFLFGLFTLAIPIIIHLFNFRKSKRIYFSSTRFLTNIKKSTSQKLKLKHYLILFSRLLFLTFLVFAFAQPYIPSADKNPQVESVYIYLDNSSSMSNRVDGTMTSLHLGMDYVSKILDLYPANTSYKLLTNEFAPFSNTLKSKDEIEELLTELRLSNISRTLPEAYTRLKSHTLRQTEKSKDVFIISDFQKSTIGNIEQLKMDSIDQVFVSPIFFDATKNIFIDSMYLSNPFLVANEKNQLNVVLKNTGFEDASELQVKLFINEIQSASSIVNIPAGGSEELTFEISYNLEKVNRCRLNFEDYPVTFDNDFYFVLKLENKIDILEIKSEESISPIEQVYGNRSLFNYSFQIASNTDYSLIRQFDLVIVNGLTSIDNSLSLELNNYIAQGGSLFIIPGEKPDMNSYRNLLASINPVVNDTSRVEISMPDLSDPFYENIFESANERIDMPNALPILNWQGQQMDLLKLKNNLNFLSGFRKQGTIFILAAPLEDQFTNFHRHALYVPVMYRIAAISKRSFEKLYYNINEPTINLRLDSLNKQDIFKLTDLEIELIPNQRISANELVLEMPKNTLNPGFYELKLEEKTKDVLAFNLDRAESYLAQMTFDEIKTNFANYNNVKIFDANDADNFSKEVKKNKFGVPLWKYAIILSLLFLLAEVLLIRFL
ncbi:MAG: BatA domain-containing protein [Cyclobacteriaceae bacterium]|nr:BatA domain-containing protein [Cyclobacteriaceae bacterium]